MKRQFGLQVNKKKSPGITAKAVEVDLAIACGVKCVYVGEAKTHFDLHFLTDDSLTFYKNIKQFIHNNTELRDGSILVCTGKFGWDDYLLLHHYEQNEVDTEQDILAEFNA